MTVMASEVLRALRNATEVAAHVEAVTTKLDACPIAVLIRCLSLCALDPVLQSALEVVAQVDLPPDTSAAVVLQAAGDTLDCRLLEQRL